MKTLYSTLTHKYNPFKFDQLVIKAGQLHHVKSVRKHWLRYGLDLPQDKIIPLLGHTPKLNTLTATCDELDFCDQLIFGGVGLRFWKIDEKTFIYIEQEIPTR